MSLELCKTLKYLERQDAPRLIVSGIFLQDGRAAFVDRKNSKLLITNIDKESYDEVDLCGILPFEYQQSAEGKESQSNDRAEFKTQTAAYGFYQEKDEKVYGKKGKQTRKSNNPQPSDINKGSRENEFVITFTTTDHSIAVVCTLMLQPLRLQRSFSVVVRDRTRTVVALTPEVFAASTPENIVVLSKDGDNLAMFRRQKKDRGGLLMTDGKGKLYFGDGDEFVACKWDGVKLAAVLRFSDPSMKFPRGSTLNSSGQIVVCCDSSHNIFSVSPDGSAGQKIFLDRGKSFGDVDAHPDGRRYLVTFWQENEWPLILQRRE
ncbi:uncharacterized protein LOC128209016 [Mya arenaria]|uniref:uncharacterized protein LOC128209016 n=1 Tax=Mya arenaria TaxID=6604 RepID=UPI0022E29ACC|nr:uncharacterized protein LOC128209016 [Mya arenaria]